MTEREFSYWLCNIEGIGRVTAGRLLKRAGSAQAVYEMKEQELAGLLSAAQLKSFQRARKEKNVKQEYQMLLKRGIRFLPVSDPEYPARLQEIPDAPQGIYVRGGLPEEGTPSVAVIGARMCSEYGKQAARYFASALAAAGVQVVSGLARGIDGISQEAALDCGGRTYAVLGCGVDVCYPAENGRLFDRIPARGGIVSEYPPGTLPQARLFPPRNRIISGVRPDPRGGGQRKKRYADYGGYGSGTGQGGICNSRAGNGCPEQRLQYAYQAGSRCRNQPVGTSGRTGPKLPAAADGNPFGKTDGIELSKGEEFPGKPSHEREEPEAAGGRLP